MKDRSDLDIKDIYDDFQVKLNVTFQDEIELTRGSRIYPAMVADFVDLLDDLNAANTSIITVASSKPVKLNAANTNIITVATAEHLQSSIIFLPFLAPLRPSLRFVRPSLSSSPTPELHREAAVKTVSWGNQWTSFNDAATWRIKANRLRGQCITGFMVWAISQDDQEGTNAKALAPRRATGQAASRGCPTGFKEVQRHGHKEIMLDTTPCMGKGHGFSRLCCPTSYKLPTCTWRGHRNTGTCKPGCNNFELEVGSINGKDACTGNNPHFLTWSRVGSGNCEWRKKAGFLHSDDQKLLCEGACSSDQLMLARESGLTISSEGGDGYYGHLAFCCSEPKKAEPRDTDPGSSGGRELQALLRKYMENPTCPATVLEPELHDMFSRKRRSLEVEAAHLIVLSGRATDCTLNNWNLLEFLYTYRAYQPRAVVEWILYNPARAGPGIRGADLASRSLCRTVGPRARSDDLSNVAQRGVDAWNTGRLGDIPNLDTILSAILSGVIALHYARWQYFRNEVNGNRPGPMLELAYWLGQRPGQTLGLGASGINCPQELEDSLWYIGSQITFPEGVPDWAELLNRWGEMVYRQGYVSVHGLRLIMNPLAGGAPNEINLENPGKLSLRGMGTAQVGGQNPYSINFLISSPNYDFVPEAPPPDREDPNRPDDSPREW
ncbi:hypothetical protein MY11210_009225 [Beauveria gryllotalpidicola]